jgi:hypothetical protein
VAKRFVYFIESGWGGPVKIGSAENPLRRLEQLQTGNPTELHLLATVDFETTTEAEVHCRFRQDRLSGEWFYPSPLLWALIRNHWCYDDRHGPRDPANDFRSLAGHEPICSVP